MRYIHSVCLAIALLALTAGPAAGLPRLSLHSPTLGAGAIPAHSPARPVELPLGLLALAGAIQVKDTGSIAAKFKTRASAASQDYASGVAGAGAAWAAGAAAGEDNYVAGVNDAIGRKAYGKGVRDAGPGKYTDNAVKLGTQRYPQGVANAEGAYAKGVGPYLDLARSLNLAPRGPKGSAQNQERANAVAKAFRMKKVGG
jgi:hypothetical protein